LDTNTATSRLVGLQGQGRGGPRRSSLTFRILTVNLIAPLVLMTGLLYMSQYRDNLILAELGTLKVQAQLFAGAIAESAVKPVEHGSPFLFAKPEEIEALSPELSRRMVRRLGENSDSRTRLFNQRGKMIGDSAQLIGPGGMVEVTPLADNDNRFSLSRVLRHMGRSALRIIPHKISLALYPKSTTQRIEDYPDAENSMEGDVSATAWQDDQGRIILTAAAPISKTEQQLGVVHLTREARGIEAAMAQVRIDILTVFCGALCITIFLSMYLAAVIGRPLKNLARAAEAIRLGQGKKVEIPDLTSRNDEIGELSEALRGMTQALWDRMDTIERFAADVSHEIKNPLTSLRSAVETIGIVKNQRDHDRLMEIIHHDVQRLDRLISDISSASRLDSELLRDEMGAVDLNMLLLKLADAHRVPLARGRLQGGWADGDPEQGTDSVIRLSLPPDDQARVRGNEGRLAQVFDNLITNALSFSPPGSPVILTVTPDRGLVTVTVEDEGPGIPENKLETIFERFYTERPKHEDYGTHSGLGLSIARQIVRAHNGMIQAENIKDATGLVRGARFTVALEKL
jgi:two-component system sensor histidine kinase ChvG